jgi:hypothetical protein
MKTVYFIVPSEDFLPAPSLLDRIREREVAIETITHTGRLADLGQLITDTSEKILAIDPDFCNWDFDTDTLGSTSALQDRTFSSQCPFPARLLPPHPPIRT